jgi:ribosome maturation factor RimP
MEELKEKIKTLAEKICQQEGAELIDIELKGHKNDLMIQITADKPFGGITIHECAIINKHLVAAIELDKVLPPEVFSLELSSPGLDRPLITRKDFMRYKGQELHFWLSEPVGIKGKKEAQGILNEVGESSLTIDAPGNPKLVLPLPAIIKGMLVI